MTTQSAYPDKCPKCEASMDGGPIPTPIRGHYAPPYRWNRAIRLKFPDADDRWKCPDCGHEWN